jgi:hypothetical protein
MFERVGPEPPVMFASGANWARKFDPGAAPGDHPGVLQRAVVSTPRQRRYSQVFYRRVLVRTLHQTTKEPACDIGSSPRR